MVLIADYIINDGCQEIIGFFNGRKIPRKMQVYIFHWHYLAVTATCSTAFNSKYRSEGWFSENNHGFLTDLVQSFIQTNRHGGLSLTCRCWSHGRNQYQFR